MDPTPVVRRRVVASLPSYPDAQAAMDRLSDEGFPVERARIVAEGLRVVEQVTGRLGWGQVLAGGALTGTIIGGLLGWLLGLFAAVDAALQLLVYGAILGAVAGALATGLTHWVSGGSRDFTSVSRLDADRYLILVEDAVADQAARLLGLAAPDAGAAPGPVPGEADPGSVRGRSAAPRRRRPARPLEAADDGDETGGSLA